VTLIDRYRSNRPRRRPYGGSEVIHRSGAKAWFELWSVSDARLWITSRQAPRLITNCCPLQRMNRTRLSNQAGKL